MNDKPGTDSSTKMKGRLIGCTVAALLVLVLTSIVSRLVVLWCPHGADCKTTAQILFWSGMLVSAIISGSAGMAARDLFERRIDRRSS